MVAGKNRQVGAPVKKIRERAPQSTAPQAGSTGDRRGGERRTNTYKPRPQARSGVRPTPGVPGGFHSLKCLSGYFTAGRHLRPKPDEHPR